MLPVHRVPPPSPLLWKHRLVQAPGPGLTVVFLFFVVLVQGGGDECSGTVVAPDCTSIAWMSLLRMQKPPRPTRDPSSVCAALLLCPRKNGSPFSPIELTRIPQAVSQSFCGSYALRFHVFFCVTGLLCSLGVQGTRHFGRVPPGVWGYRHTQAGTDQGGVHCLKINSGAESPDQACQQALP